MGYDPSKHGKANYGKFMQLPASDISGIVEGPNSESYDTSARYAQLIYQVNPSPLIISGGVISVDSVGLDDTGTIKKQGDQLKTYDEGAISGLANVVAAINSSSLSGDVVGLGGSGDVKLSGDALKVFDEAVVNAVNNITVPAPVAANYSQIVRVSGDFTYIMKSTIGGGTSGDAIWQMKRIESSGDDTNIYWADGNDNFDNVASGYLSHSYSL